MGENNRGHTTSDMASFEAKGYKVLPILRGNSGKVRNWCYLCAT
jgi:hypothetical protein